MSGFGIAIALVVDLLGPLAALLLVERINQRNARPRGTRDFWIGMAVYGGLLGFVVLLGIRSVFDYEGAGVAVAVFIALPMSLIPTIFNSFVIDPFFTTAEWADYGYFIVLVVFLVGLIPWALFGPVLIRRIAQSASAAAHPVAT